MLFIFIMFLQPRLCSGVATAPISKDVSYKRKKRLQREITKMVWKEVERTCGKIFYTIGHLAWLVIED